MNLKNLLDEFKVFIMKGNAVDLAIAIVIGTGFKSVVDSVVSDLIMPMVGYVGGVHDFSALHLGPMLVGKFINTVISFLIIASVVFFLLVKPMNHLFAIMNRKAASPPPPPVAEDIQLLREIRDLLKSKS